MALQTKEFSVTSNTFTLKLTVVENSISTPGNSSSVTYKLELISTTKDFYMYGVGAEVRLDGRTVATRSRTDDPKVDLPVRSSVTLLSGTTTIGHNRDGSKTMSVGFSIDMASASYTPGPVSGSGSMSLTKVPRGATISSAPNFNDEENPIVKVSNPAGVSVQLGIYKTDGKTALAAYRTISGTSYTFSLTSTERDALRKVSTTSNTSTVRFYVKSTVGGQTFTSYVAKTLTIKNPKPTLSPTVQDVNSKTLALTGDKNKMIKYHSNADVDIGATAVKFATLTRKSVDCAGKSLTADGVISGVESGSFLFTAVDSRGNVTSKEVVKSLVEYVKPTANIGGGTPDGTGAFDFVVSGSCFAGSFGLEDNEVTLEYHYKARGSAVWGSWTPMELSIDGTAYTAVANITGLNYQVTYEFQARITDKLDQALSGVKIVKSIPGFDWGEEDFNFNIPVSITQHSPDGSSEKFSLLKCGMTARISQNLGQISGQVYVTLGTALDGDGGCELADGGISVPYDGLYIVDGSVHCTGGVDKVWIGTSILSSGRFISNAYMALAGGIGTVHATATVVKLSAGDVVKLRVDASGSVTVGNDARTRLTVAQIL